MDISEVWEEVIRKEGGRIVYLIMDGVGGVPIPAKGGSELQAARTPNLDRLAKESSCGLLEMVGPGITPGSGPGHLALFGYDPIKYRLGRGILSALGIDFELHKGDVAARINFATVDAEGKVVDRRAGRISTETNRVLCEKIRRGVDLAFDGTCFLQSVSEHRAVLVLRGGNLGGDLEDTDPQRTGMKPLDPKPRSAESEHTAEIVRSFVEQARSILADHERANMVLLRGFDCYEPLPSLSERFGLQGVCVAEYPMYRGLCRLLGMAIEPPPAGNADAFQALARCYGEKQDFYFLHIKKTDSRGEDGDFDRKVEVIEEVDRLVPSLVDLEPDVLVVTADHSTPPPLAGHSWHPVPVMIRAGFARVDNVDAFHELACLQGALGLRPGVHLMGLALAEAGRLNKFGA